MKNDPTPTNVEVPEPRSAIYAGKYTNPPAELNTLVPEDFDFMDFNFKDLKSKKKEEEVIKTDHTFENIEPSVNKEHEPTKTEPEPAKTEVNTSNNEKSFVLVGAAATATEITKAAVLSDSKSAETKEPKASPVEPQTTAVIDEKPLVKVSEARKSLEPNTSTTKSIIVADAAESKAEKTTNTVESKETSKDAALIAGATALGAATVAVTTAATVNSDKSTKEDSKSQSPTTISDSKRIETKDNSTNAAVIAGATVLSATTAAILTADKSSKDGSESQNPTAASNSDTSKNSSAVAGTTALGIATAAATTASIVTADKSAKDTAAPDSKTVESKDNSKEAAAIAGAAIIGSATAAAAIVATDKSSKDETVSNTKPDVTAKEETKPKEKVVQELVAPPPPLPTNTAHLTAARESLKPSLLPVKPVNGAPLTDPDAAAPSKPISSNSPLGISAVNSEELEKLKKQLDQQKLALENEIDAKKALESQIQAMLSKSNAQEEALRYKNESLDTLHSDYLKINNDLTAAKSERDKLKEALTKAEAELASTSESNAKAFLEKNDEVTKLKDKLAEFAAIIGQKNKEIDSLQRQLEEAKRANMQTALKNVEQYTKIEDDLIKMVEEEILRMQDTVDEQREYNAKLQMEVDAEYAYWKRRLTKSKEEENPKN